MVVRSGALDVVVIDSVAALVPRAEIEGEMGDTHVGLQARLMSQALRKLTGTVAKSGATVIFINQIRMKIGVMFGNPETTSGGNALKFYSSIRLDVRRIAAIKDGDEVVGNRTRVKVVKNKVAPPFRQAEFDILYNEGVSFEGDLLDLGVDLGLVEKSGSWYSYDDERIGQGRENARRFMKENPDARERLAEAVYSAKGLKARGAGEARRAGNLAGGGRSGGRITRPFRCGVDSGVASTAASGLSGTGVGAIVGVLPRENLLRRARRRVLSSDGGAERLSPLSPGAPGRPLAARPSAARRPRRHRRRGVRPGRRHRRSAGRR